MKRPELKTILFVICMTGFVIGILFANFLADSFVVKTDLFSDYYLKQYRGITQINMLLVIKVLMIRVLPVMIMSAMKHTKEMKCVIMAFIIWTGFSNGLLISVELMNLGMFGMVLYVTGLFPQIIFYLVAYVMSIFHYFRCQNEVWKIKQIFVIAVLLLIGVCLECFLNPWLIRSVIGLRIK